MRKILVLALTFLMIIQSVPSNAAESKVIKYTLSEYDMMMSLTDKQIEEYNNKMFKSEDVLGMGTENGIILKDKEKIIKKVKSKDQLLEEYKEKVYKLKNWSKESLERAGYNQDQIEAIKTFDGSPLLMSRASATADCTVELQNIVQSSNKTTVTVNSTFELNGIISNMYLDVFGVGWSAPLTIVSKTGKVTYAEYDIGGKPNLTYTHTPINANSLYGLQIKFDKYKIVADPDVDLRYFVKSGSLTTSLKSNTYIADIAALCTYAYTSYNLDPYVSWNGVSFGFSSGTSQLGEDYTSN